MKRRKFFGLIGGTAAVAVLPKAAEAVELVESLDLPVVKPSATPLSIPKRVRAEEWVSCCSPAGDATAFLSAGDFADDGESWDDSDE